jgi:hypothetical protein
LRFYEKRFFTIYLILLGFGRAKVEKVEVGLICLQSVFLEGLLKSSSAMLMMVKLTDLVLFVIFSFFKNLKRSFGGKFVSFITIWEK